VPVNVAVEEPRARVVRKESNCDIITSVADTYDVSDNGVVKVVRGVTSAADHIEVVPVQMDRVLLKEHHFDIILITIREYSQVHQWHPQEWSARHSCLDRDHRYSPREVDPTHSSHRLGFGATRGQWGVRS
jgi:hypothetical protein